VGDDDHDVAFGAQAGGGAVEADVPPAGRAGDDVGFQAAAVVDVDYLHLFEGQDVGQLHQLLIDGDASFIVQVGVGNGGTVDLRLAHGAQHRHPPSFWSCPPGLGGLVFAVDQVVDEPGLAHMGSHGHYDGPRGVLGFAAGALRPRFPSIE